jgi:hypothetical protein
MDKRKTVMDKYVKGLAIFYLAQRYNRHVYYYVQFR